MEFIACVVLVARVLLILFEFVALYLVLRCIFKIIKHYLEK